jgi:hypothetical protein
MLCSPLGTFERFQLPSLNYHTGTQYRLSANTLAVEPYNNKTEEWANFSAKWFYGSAVVEWARLWTLLYLLFRYGHLLEIVVLRTWYGSPLRVVGLWDKRIKELDSQRELNFSFICNFPMKLPSAGCLYGSIFVRYSQVSLEIWSNITSMKRASYFHRSGLLVYFEPELIIKLWIF